MSDTEQPQSPPIPTSAPAKSQSGVLLTFLLFLLALVVLGGAVYYVGGVDYVTSLLKGMAPVANSGTPTDGASAVASESIDAADLESAKLTYAEQIESQDNIDRLADGDIKSFNVDSVQAGQDSAIVNITVSFRDDTSAPGALRFVRSGERWYFVTITGLRPAATKGLADATNSAKSIETTLTANQKLAQVGVVRPDQGVLQTIAEQQIMNQPVIRDLLSGEYKRYDMGKPAIGSNTFTIPVTISGNAETAVPASIVIIAKNVEGKDRLFITTFKRD